jgi:multidrug efflux system outer membrane protein
VGLPAALLDRRPDVRQAEQQLRAANAEIGVAIGNFFPQIGLTAFLGKVSPEVGMLTAGSTNAWSVAASATGPIFTSGRLTAELEQARAFWQETALRYDQTILIALREVSDALVNRDKLRGVRTEQARAVRAYEQAVKVSTQRYVAGKSSYYEVLEAQQQLFPEEIALARTRLGQLVTDVSLYKALGGGWNLATDQWGPPTTPPPTAPDLAERAKQPEPRKP